MCLKKHLYIITFTEKLNGKLDRENILQLRLTSDNLNCLKKGRRGWMISVPMRLHEEAVKHQSSVRRNC